MSAVIKRESEGVPVQQVKWASSVARLLKREVLA